MQLILKLSESFAVDLSDLQGAEKPAPWRSSARSSPIPCSPRTAGDQELTEIADAAPNAAAGIAKLYRAYKEQLGRLSDLSEILAREGHQTRLSGTRLPIDEVHEVFETRPNHFFPPSRRRRRPSTPSSAPATT